MEIGDQLATSTDPLLSCCMCKHLLREAVQLKCLHNCCRQCFSATASTVGSEGVGCGLCGLVTEKGTEQPNGYIDNKVQRYRVIAGSGVCGVCHSNGEHNKPALVWCPTCRHSLCSDCIAGHRQYNRQHVTQSLEELNSLDEVCDKPSASGCPIHKKPLDIACLICEQAKCVSCWMECNEKKHEVLAVGQESFNSYVGKFIFKIASVESELLRKSDVLGKPKRLLQDTKDARDRHLEKIIMRKRCVVDAVEMVYQKIALATKNAYDDLQAEGDAAAAAAERIGTDLREARNYTRRLIESNDKCEILNQQKNVRERLSVLSVELDRLKDLVTVTNRNVEIKASLPENVEDVVRTWIGVPRMSTAPSSPAASPPHVQQHRSFSFGPASASFKLPVQCRDVALTQDGHSLLLAAQQHGLIELSSASGRELNRWRPSKRSCSVQYDEVGSVTALSDGRAAVSLYYAQLVVLLRRNEKSCGSRTAGATAVPAAAAGDDAWTEDRHLVDQLPWPAWHLSAHGDVLAAREFAGQRLQLLSLSSGRRLSDTELQREYRIRCLAVAARVVVTGSYDKLEVGGGGRAAHVLDAHSLDADEQLWRHVLSSSDSTLEELLQGICADSSGGCLNAAMCRSDRSGGRVSALSLADGSELRRVALSFYSAAAAAAPQPLLLLLPMRLSLCDDRVSAAAEQKPSNSSGGRGSRVLLLAMLCWDSATKEWKTVTLHRSTIDMLQ